MPHKVTRELLQYGTTAMATATLLGAVMIGVVAAIVKESYDCTMSAGICGVAFLHYLLIATIRKGDWGKMVESTERVNKDTDFMCAVLRHSDWLVRCTTPVARTRTPVQHNARGHSCRFSHCRRPPSPF
jgi:hypothetical protein